MKADTFYSEYNDMISGLDKLNTKDKMQFFGSSAAASSDLFSDDDDDVSLANDFESKSNKPLSLFDDDDDDDDILINTSNRQQSDEQSVVVHSTTSDNSTMVQSIQIDVGSAMTDSQDLGAIYRLMYEFLSNADYEVLPTKISIIDCYGTVRHTNFQTDTDAVLDYLLTYFGLQLTTDEFAYYETFLTEDVLNAVQFRYRVATSADLVCILNKSLASETIKLVKEFSLATRDTSLLVTVLEHYEYNECTQILQKYAFSESALFCCLLLLNADKYDAIKYDAWVQCYADVQLEQCVRNYIENQAQTEWKSLVGHRNDFSLICDLLQDHADDDLINNYKVLDIIENYKDYFFLPQIIQSIQRGCYSTDFIDTNLGFKLDNVQQANDFKIIAEQYSNGELDLETAALLDNQYGATRICYDMSKLGLNYTNFIKIVKSVESVLGDSVQNLLTNFVLNAYDGSVDQVSYRKQLVLLAINETSKIMELMLSSQFASYNSFWLNYILQQLGLNETVPSDVGDSIFICYDTGTYLHYNLDNLILNPTILQNLKNPKLDPRVNRYIIEGVQTGASGVYLISDNSGIGITYSLQGRDKFKIMSSTAFCAKTSLTVWAENPQVAKNINIERYILMNNLYSAIADAKCNNLPIHDSVLTMLSTMSIADYQNYDMALNYIKRHYANLRSVISYQHALDKLYAVNYFCYHNNKQRLIYHVVFLLLSAYCTNFKNVPQKLTVFDDSSKITLDGFTTNGEIEFDLFLKNFEAFLHSIPKERSIMLSINSGKCVLSLR